MLGVEEEATEFESIDKIVITIKTLTFNCVTASVGPALEVVAELAELETVELEALTLGRASLQANSMQRPHSSHSTLGMGVAI